MKKKITMIILFIGLNAISQNKFEKGYFITNNNEKVTCLIDVEFSTISNTLYYKKNDGELLRENINNLKEVKTQHSYFKRHNVRIDERKILNNTKELILINKSLLLEVLINGEIELFIHQKSATNFFYKTKNSSLINLEYKKYISDKSKITDNNLFQKQLWNSFNCNNKTPSYFTNIKYSKKDLSLFFKEYLKCKNIKFVEFGSYQKKYAFNDYFILRPLVGISNSSIRLKLQETVDDLEINPSSTSITYGAEIDFTLPVLREISLSISYLSEQKINDKGEYKTKLGHNTTRNSKYYYESSFSKIPIKLRYNYFINSNKILSFNAGVNFNSLSGYYEYIRDVDDFKFISSNFKESFTSYNLGLGFKYEKYFFELNYSPHNTTLDNWEHKNNNISILIGYDLF
jgi:hypothetical protein